jgi:tetratricopeptide (TPR) repeat protein
MDMIACNEAAYYECLEVYGSPNIFTARCLYRLGRAQFMCYSMEKSLIVFKKANSMLATLGGSTARHESARTQFRMGDVYFSTANLGKAKNYYEQAIDTADKNTQQLLLANVHNNLSLLYSIMGSYGQAKINCDKAKHFLDNINDDNIKNDMCDIGEEENNSLADIIDLRKQIWQNLASVNNISAARVAFQTGNIIDAKNQFMQIEKQKPNIEESLQLYTRVYLGAIEGILGNFTAAKDWLTEANKKRQELGKTDIKTRFPLNLCISLLKYHNHAIYLEYVQYDQFYPDSLRNVAETICRNMDKDSFGIHYCRRLKFTEVMILIEKGNINEAEAQYKQHFDNKDWTWKSHPWGIMVEQFYTGLMYLVKNQFRDAFVFFEKTVAQLQIMGCGDAHYHIQHVKLLQLKCQLQYAACDHNLLFDVYRNTEMYPLLRLKIMQLGMVHFCKEIPVVRKSLRRNGWNGRDKTESTTRIITIFVDVVSKIKGLFSL